MNGNMPRAQSKSCHHPSTLRLVAVSLDASESGRVSESAKSGRDRRGYGVLLQSPTGPCKWGVRRVLYTGAPEVGGPVWSLQICA
jgi:hypothetical protein